MNAIAPHNPPVQGSPRQLPAGGGRKDDPAFGDFLAGEPPKVSPAPIDDYSPLPGPDEPDADDPSVPPLPRPIRWQDGKGPGSDSQGPDAAAGIPLLPAQIDLRAVVPGVTLSGTWGRPVSTPESNDGIGAATGSDDDRAVPGQGGMTSGASALPGATWQRGEERQRAADVQSGGEGIPSDDGAASGQGNGASRADAFPSTTWEQGGETSHPVPASKLTRSPDVSPAARVMAPGFATPTPATGAQPVSIVLPTATTDPATDGRAELSASVQTDEAKIAAAVQHEAPPTQDSRLINSQTAFVKILTKSIVPDGTPVAKDASVVTAALPSIEDEPETSPLPRRDGKASGGVPSPARGNSPVPGREVSFAPTVAGPAIPGATTSQISETPAPEPTAARHAVKVETLLQNALSAGESLRPNGHEHMEMRVRLGGGSEDVTIRLQVANDRLQITFQTNSPEMRKALEHGWEQFSASASESSTLALATPRFETGPAGFVPQGPQADAQAFSSQQQDSRRRQDAPDPFVDEAARLAGTNRSAVSTDQARPATPGQATSRRWTGWA